MSREKAAKTILEILASHVASEPSGHFVFKLLAKFNGPTRHQEGNGNCVLQWDKAACDSYSASKSEDRRRVLCGVLSILSNRKELSTERMRCPF
jgi:hypothetical protein